MKSSRNSSHDAPQPQLEPLFVAWDAESRRIPWRRLDDSATAVAELPFGVCRLSVAPEEMGRRAVVELQVTEAVRLHQLELRWSAPWAAPERVYTPYLKNGKNRVFADQVFRSPAVFVEKNGWALALLPDLAHWPEGVKTYLDFSPRGDDGRPLLIYGLGHWRTTGHVFFQKSRARRPLKPGTVLTASCRLLSLPAQRMHGQVASYLWRQFARRGETAPQVLLFAEAEALVCRRILAPDLFRTFQADGRPVGGMITQTLTARRRPRVMNARETASYLRNQERLVKLLGLVQTTLFTNAAGNRLLTEILHAGWMKIVPMIFFQCWFNQVRTALGVALHARRSGDEAAAKQAALMVELALAAPAEDGIFASVCLFPENRVAWKRGTRAFALIDAYHLPDAAVTGFHLLEWHETVRRDERIINRCRALADFFLARQDEAGAFPAWMERHDGGWRVVDELARSAAAAAPAMLLARLQRLAPEPGRAAALRRALAFLEREVLPADRWFDFELFHSCAGRPTGADGPDPETGVYPANTLSMYWAARACLDFHLAQDDPQILALGRRILDRLSLYQQVYDHPRVSIDTFGGFAVMNADAEFNDARQGVFAPLYLDYYAATGEAELFERGVAALRAGYTTMLTPEQERVAPGNLRHYRESDRGAILENYGHSGRDEMTNGYLSPDWGCGTALYASGTTFSHYGQVYLDLDRQAAFGIDLCHARMESSARGIVRLAVEGEATDRLEIVVHDAAGRLRQLWVNGRRARRLPRGSDRYLVADRE